MSAPAIHRDVLPNGLRLLTERMSHVRSVSIGVWLTRGSRHEPSAHEGIAHFVEHMLFKGTATRSAEDIAQQIDSIGGHLDAFTSKEYAGYFIKVLDEHLPLAVDVLSDLVTAPAFDAAEIEREKKVVLEEIKMVEDTPDDLVHEIFAGGFWPRHPLGRPILGQPETVSALDQPTLRRYFTDAYVASNFIVAAVGNLEHGHVRQLVERAFQAVPARGSAIVDVAPTTVAEVVVRSKELEQSHVCFGTPALAYNDPDRYVAFALNTMLGGSMSSRLFQNVREKRGLAYSVFSSLSSYRDSGALTIYAGCANESVPELVDVVVQELRRMKSAPLAAGELRRAKDHLKGSLMLGLESTSSRMSHLARLAIYDDAEETLDAMLAAIEQVTESDVARLAQRVLAPGTLGLTVLGGVNGLTVSAEQLALASIPRYTNPEMGRIWTEQRRYEAWLQVELAAADAMAGAGLVPPDAVVDLKKNARFDIARIEEIEKTTQHDVIAFTTSVAEHVGPSARWLHFGLTSSDVVDTAQALQLVQAMDVILRLVGELRTAIAARAEEHRRTPMIGRTHGVHAEPMTFGLKLALWYDQLGRDLVRLRHARESVRVGMISGAVGTFAHLDPAVEADVCRQLGLEPAPISTQVIQRDRHAELLSALAITGASLETFALEIRGLHKTEIGEVEEPFGKGQKGSSAMPHKRNPVGSEQIVGLARLLRANAGAAFENVALWHERDISHSSVERVILPDSFIALDHMLRRFTRVVTGMVVYPARMRENLERSRGVVFSGQVLLELAKRGIAREQAYEWVQRNAMRAFDEQTDFKALLLQDSDVMRVLGAAEIERAFDLDQQLRNVDVIFARVFEPVPAGKGF